MNCCGKHPSKEDLDVVRLMAAGFQDGEIAKKLGLSVRTVRRRIADLMTYLDARSRFQMGFLVGTREWLAAAPGSVSLSERS